METSQSVEFQLAPPSTADAVSVQLRDFVGRWSAVVETSRDQHIGLGATAREALSAALAPLGPRLAAAFMADTTLFGVSAALRGR